MLNIAKRVAYYILRVVFGVQHPNDSPFLSIPYARIELVWTKTSQGAQSVQNLVFNTGRIVQSAVSTAVR